jgi:mono/diheme cytochrome c family protein
MKKIFLYIVPAAVISITACTYDDIKKPGHEFMPDMYISPSYETYSSNPLFSDSMTSRQPVAGTIARGDAIFTDYDRLPYPYPNTPEGYEAAGVNLHNPLENTPENMAEGQRLYMNYCIHCHGETGMGDGLVTIHNGPKPPPYSGDQLKGLPVGKMYHTIHWGKNMMGSHASQLTPTQRWKIIMFVQTLQHPVGATASADSTKTTAAPAEQKK